MVLGLRFSCSGHLMPDIQSFNPIKNADPLAPMATGRHSDSPTTKASAISPVAHPINATPTSHLTVSDQLVLF